MEKHCKKELTYHYRLVMKGMKAKNQSRVKKRIIKQATEGGFATKLQLFNDAVVKAMEDIQQSQGVGEMTSVMQTLQAVSFCAKLTSKEVQGASLRSLAKQILLDRVLRLQRKIRHLLVIIMLCRRKYNHAALQSPTKHIIHNPLIVSEVCLLLCGDVEENPGPTIMSGMLL